MSQVVKHSTVASAAQEQLDDETTRLWEHVELFADLMNVVQRFALDLRARARALAELVDERSAAAVRAKRSAAAAKTKAAKRTIQEDQTR